MPRLDILGILDDEDIPEILDEGHLDDCQEGDLDEGDEDPLSEYLDGDNDPLEEDDLDFHVPSDLTFQQHDDSDSVAIFEADCLGLITTMSDWAKGLGSPKGFLALPQEHKPWRSRFSFGSSTPTQSSSIGT